MYGLTLVTAATEEPVSIAEAGVHTHVSGSSGESAHAEKLEALIAAAREHVETETGRQLVTATWRLTLDRFPRGQGAMLLPKAPLASVTFVKYDDADDVEQTMSAANYVVSTGSEPGRISLTNGSTWPIPKVQADSVRVEYVAGYGAASAVPTALKQAILLMVGHWFENREAVVIGSMAGEIPLAAQRLIRNYAVGEEFTDYACGTS